MALAVHSKKILAIRMDPAVCSKKILAVRTALAVCSNKKKTISCFVESEIRKFKACRQIVKRIGYYRYLYCHTSSFVKMRE